MSRQKKSRRKVLTGIGSGLMLAGFSSTISGARSIGRDGTNVVTLTGTAEEPVTVEEVENIERKVDYKFNKNTDSGQEAAKIAPVPSTNLRKHFVAGFAYKIDANGQPKTYIGYGTSRPEESRSIDTTKHSASIDSTASATAERVHDEVSAVSTIFKKNNTVTTTGGVSANSKYNINSASPNPDVDEEWHQYNQASSTTYDRKDENSMGKVQVNGNLYRIPDDEDAEPNQNLWASVFSHNVFHENCNDCVLANQIESMYAEHRWGNHFAEPGTHGLVEYYPHNPRQGEYDTEYAVSGGASGPSASISVNYHQPDVELDPSSSNHNVSWDFPKTEGVGVGNDLFVNLSSSCWMKDDISNLPSKPAVGSTYNKAVWTDAASERSAYTELVYKHKYE